MDGGRARKRVTALIGGALFALFAAFVVSGVLLLETGGASKWGRALLVISCLISAVQIAAGCVIRQMKRKKDDECEALEAAPAEQKVK